MEKEVEINNLLPKEPITTTEFVKRFCVSCRAQQNFKLVFACVSFLVIGFIVGYQYRAITVKQAVQQALQQKQLEEQSQRKTLTNFIVLKTYSERHFDILAEWGEKYSFDLCPDSFADWKKGEKGVYAWYVQRNGCKTFAGYGLGFKMDEVNGVRVKVNLQEIANVF